MILNYSLADTGVTYVLSRLELGQGFGINRVLIDASLQFLKSVYSNHITFGVRYVQEVLCTKT